MHEEIPREQKEKELREAGWTPEIEDGKIYTWWSPVIKEVLDTDHEHRTWGTDIDHAYSCLLYKREAKQKKDDRDKGLHPVMCNKCGTEMRKFSPVDSYIGTYGAVHQEVHGGYFSEHLSDAVTYCFNICEACLVELFGEFKIPPATTSYI